MIPTAGMSARPWYFLYIVKQPLFLVNMRTLSLLTDIAAKTAANTLNGPSFCRKIPQKDEPPKTKHLKNLLT